MPVRLLAADAGLPGAFLRFGVGGRAAGMGHAYAGLAEGAEGVYLNPAGIFRERSPNLALEHTPLVLGGAYQYFGYVQPIGDRASLGAGFVNAGSGDVPRFSAGSEQTGHFQDRESAVLVSYAHSVHPKLVVGITGKAVEHSIDTARERGGGFDIGAQSRLSPRFSLGAVLQNLVRPSYSFPTETERFPVTFRCGGVVGFLGDRLRLAADVDRAMESDQPLRPHFGIEGIPNEHVAARFGIQEETVSLGAGIFWRSLAFDYAARFHSIGITNVFSLKMVFSTN